MEEMGENRWVRPYFGPYPPDPNCPKCKGTGKEKIRVIFSPDKADSVWVGICPICGEENGIHLHYDKFAGKEVKLYEDVPCLNKDCPNEFVTFVRLEEDEENE